jgi:hypothetical protein
MNTTQFGNPEKIKRICEWTGKEFYIDYKHRKQRFIDKNAMYEWRKSQNRETVTCLNCGKPFERYKKILHYRSGKPTQYCSVICSQSSIEVSEKQKEWTIKHQPMNNPLSVQKIAITKCERYGDPNYNNIEKNKQTCMSRYGVPYSVYLPQATSNGVRISKFQKRVYTDMLKIYTDAKLEVYLHDVQKSVDIFIPSKNKVIECYGDYWHCNPDKCQPDYYNKLVHLTAQEIWDKDSQKQEILKKSGYNVEVVWENTNKTFKHSTK